MARRILNGKRYWKFEPEPMLTTLKKHHSPRKMSTKLSAMRKSLLEARPKENEELTHKGRDKIHPELRSRLPAGSRRADFNRVAEQLKHGEQLALADIRGAHFYPAVVDTSLLTKQHSTEDIYGVRTFLDIPGHEERLFMPTTYVEPRLGHNYFVEAYGMQYSDPRNIKEKAADLKATWAGKSMENPYPDIREHVPKGLHRTFDTGAPLLGLSLTSALLRKAGANVVGVPGHELQWWRKGTRRPQARAELETYAKFVEQDPYSRKKLQYILDNWDTLRGPGVRKVLAEIAVKTGQKFPNVYGISKTLLDRNYKATLETMGAKKITARDALGPTAAMHLGLMWGVPEPERLLDLTAYDVAIPKVDSLHPFLKPMTKKEVADWKQKMKDRGHDIDHITGKM